ncbi:unnamed protein product [Peniophora sp. CBMAI 1063]|nr:unnamed protein product [Peniophora sp. CBMAI 1063]
MYCIDVDVSGASVSFNGKTSVVEPGMHFMVLTSGKTKRRSQPERPTNNEPPPKILLLDDVILSVVVWREIGEASVVYLHEGCRRRFQSILPGQKLFIDKDGNGIIEGRGVEKQVDVHDE